MNYKRCGYRYGVSRRAPALGTRAHPRFPRARRVLQEKLIFVFKPVADAADGVDEVEVRAEFFSE